MVDNLHSRTSRKGIRVAGSCKASLRAHRSKGVPYRTPRHSRYPTVKRIKPSADARLKKVFARIGIPAGQPLKPDPFQRKALAAIRRSDCLVSAPTGSGKTWIAEEAIARIRKKGGRAWYASPLKALTNSKYVEFSERFGSDQVGILTGDRKENADAPIITGTTEILRNQLYDTMHEGVDLSADLVILDEAHFLGDKGRGVVWEEIMIYLPVRIPLLLLSATIRNARKIADWLESIRSKACVVVEETRRPVPLYPLFLHPSGRLLPFVGPKGMDKKVKAYLSSPNPPVLAPPRSLPPFGKIIRVLRKFELLPAIFFLKSRADCDAAIHRCLDGSRSDRDRRIRLNERINELTRGHPRLAGHRQMSYLRQAAVAAHHGGQLPAWKLVIERLMAEGWLDAAFATTTVAAGVNFPARSIVFLNSDQYNGHTFVPLNATEFHQMTGRAGRRGKDHIGFAVAVPGRSMDLRLFAELCNAPPEDVVSQIRVYFSMVLNLLLSHTPSEIREIFQRSFATYLNLVSQQKGVDRTRLWNAFVKHLAFLKKEGFVTEENSLTHDGVWTSQLRLDQPLMIADGLRLGVLPDADPALLAALVAPLVYDRDMEVKLDESKIPKRLFKAYEKMNQGLRRLMDRKTVEGFEVRPIAMWPAATVYAWANGQPWERVLQVAGMAEGDLAMLVSRTADNLRQIASLTKVYPAIARTAAEAIAIILREPVLTE